jgi:membrane-bound inhibitor of C-type lysozyme
MKNHIYFIFLFNAFALLMACSDTITHDDKVADPLDQHEQVNAQTYVYECSDGYSFIARIDTERAWLFLREGTISLPHAPSGSGAKYSEGQIIFWSKGDQARLESGDEKHINCKNNRAKAIWEDAKLRGVDFRAVGNEPGWNLEIITGEKIVFVGDYGQVRYEFASTESAVDQQERKTIYTAQDREHELSIVIDGRPCRDTMSGEPFETTVTIMLNGKKYRGCGKALH